MLLANTGAAEYELLNNELRNLRDINTSLEADLREVTTRLESTQLHAEDKIRQMINSEQRLGEQFENLANRIFEHSNRRVDEQNRQSLNSLLTPLRNSWTVFAVRCRTALVRKPASGTRWRQDSQSPAAECANGAGSGQRPAR